MRLKPWDSTAAPCAPACASSISASLDSQGPGGSENDPAQESVSSKKIESTRPFPIVAVGASAGGLQALEELFSELPTESGIAFTVISHTDPRQISILPEILQRKTRSKVVVVKDGMTPEPDAIYLPPSGKDLVIRKGLFHLIELQRSDGIRLPIDTFLKSLAEDRGEFCGCIILSGTGTDGTQGVRAIKERGGLTVAQSPETAMHSGMPQSAIATGFIDFILHPSKMPAKLIQYFKDYRPGENEDQSIAANLKKILSLLSRKTKQDFSLYKKSTIIRRIGRRLKVTGQKDGAAYCAYLQKYPEEADLLFNDLLIGVTSFFRDPEAFAALENEVIPALLSRIPANESFRVWIPGCATGEEAYSVSILLNEVMESSHLRRDVQIFATDIDKHAINKAREGVYVENISNDVSPERLKRYFVKEGQFFRVKKEVREPVVFAVQNVLGNPPFSRLDLLICRNLLIYLEAEAQRKLIPLFHYTLRPGGSLFLGSSESIGRFTDLFAPINKKWSIFRKQDGGIPPAIEFPAGGRPKEELMRAA